MNLGAAEYFGGGDTVVRSFQGSIALPVTMSLGKRWPEVLGVPPHASHEVIDSALRRVARTHHPDVGGDTPQFQEIQWAHDEPTAS